MNKNECSPCFNCQKRKLYCHSSCIRYGMWKRKIITLSKTEKSARRGDAIHRDYTINSQSTKNRKKLEKWDRGY